MSKEKKNKPVWGKGMRKMRWPWKWLFWGAVVALAVFFRVYKINQIPPSLNWDEVSHGYNAYSIFKTGRDEWGESWPLIFCAYGDYKLPLYIYLISPIVGLAGINPLAVRSISILSGIGLVVVAYLITKKLGRSEAFSIFAAFLTALSPWSLFVSRVALEANLAAFFFSLAVYFWLNWVESFFQKHLALAALFWAFSIYSYNSARVLVPVFVLLSFGVMIKRKLPVRKVLVAALLLLIFSIPLATQFFDKSALARFDNVSLIDEGMVNRIILARADSNLPPALRRLVFNRPVYFVFYSLKNYLSNFSPQYLFFRGGSHYQFSQPDHELLYLVSAPFLLLGIAKAIARGSRLERLVVVWFLLAFIPSAVTRDAPHVLRSLLVLPSPMILSALGLEAVCRGIGRKSFAKGKALISVLVLAVLVSFGCWWKDYQQVYPFAYSWAWQYGYKEAVLFAKDSYAQYDRIIITKRYGEPHEFVLAYFPWDPKAYQADETKKWDYHAGWYWVDGFDKFVFVNDWEIGGIKCPRGSCLLITSPGNYPLGWSKIKTIELMDGQPAFEILKKIVD
jgi:4-amino-4-deoxy-L-arabinose transferase-like glycosyltransferase